MENKYYTPTIEEFHVGFEFETNNVSTLPKEKQIWKQMIATPNIIGAIDYDLSTNSREGTYRNESIRVKYLDQSDIESLGWKDCDNISNTIRWDFNDYILMFYKKDNRYLIFRDCGPNNIQTVFNGFIKNKSELIKLQQQLDIK